VSIVDARHQLSEWYLLGFMKYQGNFRFKLIDYELPETIDIKPPVRPPVEFIPVETRYEPPREVQYAGILKWMAPAGQGTHPSRKYKFIREILVYRKFKSGTSMDEIQDEMYQLMRDVLDDMDYPDIDTISSWRVPPGSISNFEVAAVSSDRRDGEYDYYDIKKENYPIAPDAIDSGEVRKIKSGRV